MNNSQLSINKNICFDLQFRKDVKHKRFNKPVYYSWKAQFVIVGGYQDEDLLRKIQKTLNCGQLHFLNLNKIRYSVQKINNLHNKIVPYFKKHELSGNKKKDFELWAQAVEILFKNKRKELKKWKKQDFLEIIEIQKKTQKYKIKKTQGEKWIPEAQIILEAISSEQG